MNDSTTEIILFPASPTQNEFEEALNYSELPFMASTLESVGFEPPEEIVYAVEKAMRICSHCGVSLSGNFKIIYIADEANHTVRRDWRLSKLAYSLVMLNGSTDNPIVGQMQLEILRRNI